MSGPVDVLTAASQTMHAAKKASDAADEAIAAPAKRAGRIIADGVLEAYRIDKEVFDAFGQGAQDLVNDARSMLAAPLFIIALLWLATK